MPARSRIWMRNLRFSIRMPSRPVAAANMVQQHRHRQQQRHRRQERQQQQLQCQQWQSRHIQLASGSRDHRLQWKEQQRQLQWKLPHMQCQQHRQSRQVQLASGSRNNSSSSSGSAPIRNVWSTTRRLPAGGIASAVCGKEAHRWQMVSRRRSPGQLASGSGDDPQVSPPSSSALAPADESATMPGVT